MSSKIFQALLTVVLGCIGSIMAFLVQDAVVKYYGYLLMAIAVVLVVTWIYRHYPKLLGISWRYATSVLILKDSSVLLIWHPYHNVWLPPGHRVSFQEYPHESARKAVLRETGYHVEFVKAIHHQEKMIDRDTLQVPQPYCVMREDQEQRGGIQSHYDFYYVAEIVEEETRHSSVLKARWFTLEELEGLVAKGELYKDVQEIVTKAMNDIKVIT